MSLLHGKKYKKIIESMKTIDEEMIDLSSNINALTTETESILSTYDNKLKNYSKRNTGNDLTGDIMIDICSNHFRINNKNVIKKIIGGLPTSGITINADYNNIDLTNLNTYEEIDISNIDSSLPSINLIKGTDIPYDQVTGWAGEHIYSMNLIDPYNDVSGNKNGTCYIGGNLNPEDYDLSYNNIISPFNCKQLAVDNYKRYYLMQDNKCYLTNNEEIKTKFTASTSAAIDCSFISDFHIGNVFNSSYGIYDTNQVGNVGNYLKGGYVDFDSNFVENSNMGNSSANTENVETIFRRKFQNLGVGVSCETLLRDTSSNGYVMDNSNNYCHRIDNDILNNPSNRVYSEDHNIIMKNKRLVEGYTRNTNSAILSRYKEITLPTFSIGDILKEEILLASASTDEFLRKQTEIIELNDKIYKELENYNKILRESNLKLSEDINQDMRYVTSQKNSFDSMINNNNNTELENKLKDRKIVLGYSHSNYIMWSILGITTIMVLLKVSKS